MCSVFIVDHKATKDDPQEGVDLRPPPIVSHLRLPVAF